MCVSAIVSCRTCETSHFGASWSPTTNKSNFLLDLTNFVISSTDIFTTTTHTSNQCNRADHHREESNRVASMYTLPFMFQVMIHTQSTELVVNSQAFWIGIVFMPSWVPPSSIETRLFLCSWLLLQCYRYQDQEVQAYQKQLFKVQIKYHVGRVKLLQLPMSTY